MKGSLDRVFSLPVATHEMYGLFSPDRSRLLSGGDGANPEIRIWMLKLAVVSWSSKDTNNLSPRSPGLRINDWSPQVPLAAR